MTSAQWAMRIQIGYGFRDSKLVQRMTFGNNAVFLHCLSEFIDDHNCIISRKKDQNLPEWPFVGREKMSTYSLHSATKSKTCSSSKSKCFVIFLGKFRFFLYRTFFRLELIESTQRWRFVYLNDDAL